jgi:hypothetical protein
MNSNPNYGMPANFAEEKLLMEAERAARKCTTCGMYGCDSQQCLQHESRIQAVAEPVRVLKVHERKSSNFWFWLLLFWMFMSFVAGIAGDQVFRMVR